MEQPFSMTVSSSCLSYYVQSPNEDIAQGRGRCVECKKDLQVRPPVAKSPRPWTDDHQEVDRRSSSSNTDEDMKVRILTKKIGFITVIGLKSIKFKCCLQTT